MNRAVLSGEEIGHFGENGYLVPESGFSGRKLKRLGRLADELIASNPDFGDTPMVCPHMLWGIDWPHPALNDFMPKDGDLLDALDDYAPELDLKRAILVDNPARLYGFEA